MYNNPYSNPYLPININTLVPSPVSQQMEIQKVNGEESAKAYPIGPNSSVILLDTKDPLIWVVTTDASGYKMVSPFTITPYTPEEPVSANDLKAQMTEINERLNKIEERLSSYGQSNHGSTWKNKPSNANNNANVRNGQSSQEPSGNYSANVTE